jgi:hypothetical protein
MVKLTNDKTGYRVSAAGLHSANREESLRCRLVESNDVACSFLRNWLGAEHNDDWLEQMFVAK